MSATLTNGKPQRKQLTDQLDRLDGIIDCLADALPAAVADAVRDGARQAVKDAVVELLANPELRGLFARPAADPPAPTPPAPSRWTRLKTHLVDIRRRMTDAARPAAGAAAEACRAAGPAVAAVVHALGLVWQFRTVALVGLGVGLVTAAVSYLAPTAVSAAIGGIGGACTALAVRGGLWVRAAARKLGLA